MFKFLRSSEAQCESGESMLSNFFYPLKSSRSTEFESLLEVNGKTMAKVENLKLWNLDRKEGIFEQDQLKHKYPFNGVVGCSVKDTDFLMFHLNDDVVAWRFMWLKSYESKLFEWFSDFIVTKKPKHFLDVGAYTGCYSLFAAKNGLTVDAFEMVPRTVERLKINVHLNSLRSKIKIHSFGVSDHAGIENVHMPRVDDFLGTGNSVNEKARVDTISRTYCKVRPLDDWWNEAGNPKIDVIKLDVEEHEIEAINGAKEMIRACKPHIVAEVEVSNSSKMQELCLSLGYTMEPCLGINKILTPVD